MENEYVDSSESESTDEDIDVDDLKNHRLKSVRQYSELKIDDTKEHEFQLYYMYYLLDRTTGNIKDKRVFFSLDTWQFNVLNLVDRKKSALVACPTSSGKTFICYYIMDKLLRLNDDSVVIYVAPNDTLALQVYHEVHGRFSSKCFSKNSSNILCSYMTEATAEDKALYSQILIVLPNILEDILLACYNDNEVASNAYVDSNSNVSIRNFISKIEYIIFDEIHCIGDKEFYGSHIENIIHLTNCPFLALSATIGNVESFYTWLKGVLTSKGKNPRDLHLIKFYERYSDLILYVYTNKNIHHLNPLACLSFRDILYKGITKEFYCNPREIYQIVKILFALAKHKGFYNLVHFLEPSYYFQYTRCIVKKQFIYYMHSVKEIITYLVQHNYITSEDYSMIIHLLLSNYVKNEEFLKKESELEKEKGAIPKKAEETEVKREKESNEDKREELLNDTVENRTLSRTKHLYDNHLKKENKREIEELYKELYRNVIIDEHFYKKKKNDLIKYTETKSMEQEYLNGEKLLELLKKLENGNFLPCIVFNFERVELEDMTMNLINELKKRQYDKYYGDEERTFNTKMENKIRQEKYESLLKQREIYLKMKTASRTQKLEQNIDKKTLEMLDEDLIPEKPLDVAEEYDGDFYFCNRKVFFNYESEIEELIKDAERSIGHFRNREVLVEGLKRGIGLHYEALPYRFTITVESLFRMGYLKIIFSNRNLSLGINIPCKSIIFAGHSLELNSYMFRQMSGRAGRRGFDLYGNIIIWNINFKNLKKLVTSPLQALSGQYTVNLTNICRCMILYNSMEKKKEINDLEKKKKAISANKVSSVMTNKKKKKMAILSVAEKEIIFELNRNINVDFYCRLNGILSMFFNSLYFIKIMEKEKEKSSHLKTVLGEDENKKKRNNEINHDYTTRDVNNVGEEKRNQRHWIESECLSYSRDEFNKYKSIVDTLSNFVHRKYEYNEILYEILTLKEERRRRNEKGIKSKEVHFMIKTHFLMLMNVLIEMGALDEKGNLINLTELSVFLKREGDGGFIFIYLLIQKIIHLMIGDSTFLSVSKRISMNKIIESTTYEKDYSRAIIVNDFSRSQFILLFILAHFINKIKENNVAVTRIFIAYNRKHFKNYEIYSSNYFPLLHDLPKIMLKYVTHLSSIILKYLKNYALLVVIKLNLINRKKSYLLPFTDLYIFDEHPALSLEELLSGEGPYVQYMKATTKDYKVRSPFLASMFGSDEFQSTGELLKTCLNDLDLSKNMIPDFSEDKVYFYRFVDGLMKEEIVCLSNSYILDYFIHGNPDYIQRKNRIGHTAWLMIDRFIDALNNIKRCYYEMKRQKSFVTEDMFYQALITVKETLDKHLEVFNIVSISH